MSEPAIVAKGLSKCYQLGVIGRQTLQDEIRYWWHKSRKRDPRQHMGILGGGTGKHEFGPQQSQYDDDRPGRFWALRDVSFEIYPGETVGIIGRNGAGKSTLLKILARITEPERGEAFINGRIASLLEVGTGFHPELTGRENVFLNGTILGMKRAEVRAKFDAIVAFAELEKFIDTPVKRYSSGMHVRLAFAVAAHLDPEILLVDEVLAVGDMAFQKKCLGKMSEVAGEGRTVLFVSHNMSAVNRLCLRSILLDRGRIEIDGPSHEVTSVYFGSSKNAYQAREWALSDAPGRDGFKLLGVRLRRSVADDSSVFEVKDELALEIRYRLERDSMTFRCAVVFYTQGCCAFASVEKAETTRRRKGEYISCVKIPPHLLTEGEYTAGVSIFTSQGTKQHYVKQHEAIQFQMVDNMDGSTARGDYAQNLGGVVRPMLEWDEEFVDD